MTMTCKINKLEKPGGQLIIFQTLFGRSATFYGHFRADTVTSEWSTRMSASGAFYSNTPTIRHDGSTFLELLRIARCTLRINDFIPRLSDYFQE